MEELDGETSRETAMRTEAKRFRVVAIVAAVLSVAFAIPHLASSVSAGGVEGIYSSMGGELPPLTLMIVNLSRTGLLAVLLIAIDAALFVWMYVLAKRYWIGLLFAPPLMYMAITSLLAWAIYTPMFQVITLVG